MKREKIAARVLGLLFKANPPSAAPPAPFILTGNWQ